MSHDISSSDGLDQCFANQKEYRCPPHNGGFVCVCAEIEWVQKILIKLVHHPKKACH